MQPRAIIFDMDGLMIDSERHYREVQIEMGRRRGVEVPPTTFGRMMGRTPIESLRVFKEDLGLQDSAEELLAERTARMQERMRRDVALMPGLQECIDAFSGRIPLAVATGSQREFLQIVLERFSLADRFATTITADEVTKGKPDPEAYLTAARKLGVPPDECIVLEDAQNGVVAAKRAGCYCIAVPSAWTGTQDFSTADEVARDLHDAKDRIMRMMGSGAESGAGGGSR